MLTTRGLAVLGGGALLWAGSRIAGSPDLHMIAVGLVALVPLAWVAVRWFRPNVEATRRLSTRRAAPGTRIGVEIEVHNLGRRRTPFLLLQDALPSSLGGRARLVVPSLPPGSRETVSYKVVAGARGRYQVGPLTVSVGDPFDLVRRQVEMPTTHDLIVFPGVEDLKRMPAPALPGSSGDSSNRQILRSGEDFYTMRGYEVGDDLRRIHWPSTARAGELMIRQDEASRRVVAALLVDTRGVAFAGSEPFERAVSAAASIGAHHVRAGYDLRVATPDLHPRSMSVDSLMEHLALVSPSRVVTLTPTLLRLRSASASGATVLVVTGVPSGAETGALTRLSTGWGTRIAVLVAGATPPKQTRKSGDHRDPDAAASSLRRAGWEVLVLGPRSGLAETWQRRTKRALRGIAASF